MAELSETMDEEEEALEAILDREFERLPGRCIQLTLLWDASTGEAPWAFSAAHLDGDDDALQGRPGAPSSSASRRCEECVVPGCKLPTNRHVASAYCTKAHASIDAANQPAHYFASLAGYRPDGTPLPPSERLGADLVDAARPDAHNLHSLQLLVCTRAAVPAWPYPRAPPLVAVRCAQLLPRTQLELTRVVLR